MFSRMGHSTLYLPASLVFFASCFLPISSAWQFPPPPSFDAKQRPIYFHDDVDIISGSQFSGLKTYANLPYMNCFSEEEAKDNPYDIAVVGAPFDTAVTGRPGARYGPTGIRVGSQRISPDAAWSVYTGKNPLKSWATIKDCGDVPLTWLDNTYALKQLDKAHSVVSGRKAANLSHSVTPRTLTLGGDHTTTLSALRPLTSWQTLGTQQCLAAASQIMRNTPNVAPHRSVSKAHSYLRGLNHGTFLHIAHEEGLITNTSLHAGIRAPLARRKGDMRNDVRCGFHTITARDLDRLGTMGVISRIKERVGEANVYVSVDIDVLDPAFAPATGTAEPGGWSTRELLTILDGLGGLRVVGADVVEVAPVYDNAGETTVLAAAEVAFSLLGLMVDRPVQSLADQGM
ncbi:putative Arginase [Seiridium cardinale]|uniref:Arginase n=1 Tax=Seiridium cardinale TaxID=138064 RepID=A0ABR2XP87_9PEZI